MRPTWTDTWADLARAIARRSRCDRAQIGSVIVDAQNRVLATAYNGPPANYWPANEPMLGTVETTCKDWCARACNGPTPETAASYEDCPANHSEINALLVTDRSQREGGTIFVTGSVCFTCAKAIANSGLARVVIVDQAHDGSDEHRKPERSVEFLEMSGVEVEWVVAQTPTEQTDSGLYKCPKCQGPIQRDMIERPTLGSFRKFDPGPWYCPRGCPLR